MSGQLYQAELQEQYFIQVCNYDAYGFLYMHMQHIVYLTHIPSYQWYYQSM